MTFVRSAPALLARRVDTITDHDRRDLERLVAGDPIVNAVVAARLACFRSVAAGGLGGTLLGARAARGAPLSGAAFSGGNLLPISGEEPDWYAIADEVAMRACQCTSVVGRADAVAAIWRVLEPVWGPARAVRDEQLMLVLARGDEIAITPDPRLRAMRPADIEDYLPAAAAMFTEELGISPFAGSGGSSYRRRVEALLAGGRGFGIVDGGGRLAFKADLGALTRETCQVQGVWVRPDLRGRGLGTAALAGVLSHALRLAPTASLYVNDFNTAARRMYARLGMRQVATLSTVLLEPR